MKWPIHYSVLVFYESTAWCLRAKGLDLIIWFQSYRSVPHYNGRIRQCVSAVMLRPWHHLSHRYYCHSQQPNVLIWKHTKALRAHLTISPHYGLTCYLTGCLHIRKTWLWQVSAGRHIAGSKADKQELCLKHILLLFYIKPLQVWKKST